MSLTLETIEKRLQTLVEGHLITRITERGLQTSLTRQLALAIKSNLGTNRFNQSAPDIFTLIVSPSLAKQWQEDAELISKVGEVVRIIAKETGLRLDSAPAIAVSADAGLSKDEVRVVASHRLQKLTETQNMPPDSEEGEGDNEELPRNAFLIIGGVKVFPLNQAVINIGRRSDNQLVLDDPRISRYHAQIRGIKGRYMLFDLNSTGGTYVNGKRISQTVLYPGDVVSLAGLPVIFGQENQPSFPSMGDTRPNPASASDRPTAILRPPTEE